jgi:hypothetical protein
MSDNNLHTGISYEEVSEYLYLVDALRIQWEQFLCHLDTISRTGIIGKKELDKFKKRELQRLKKINRAATKQDLITLIDKNLKDELEHPPLFVDHHESLTPIYVTVTLLSHTLCEAVINKYMAVTMEKMGRSADFDDLEKKHGQDGLLKKCITWPKDLDNNYKLSAGSLLGQTIKRLGKERNVLTHYKVELSVNGQRVQKGKQLEPVNLENRIRDIRRFFSVPYDLADHLRVNLNSTRLQVLIDNDPIERAEGLFDPSKSGLASLIAT